IIVNSQASGATMNGGAGNDFIIGNIGNGTISGGDGHDTVFGGGVDDRITMEVTAGDVDSIDAGTGNNTLVLTGTVPGDHIVVVNLNEPDQVVSIGGVTDSLVQTGFENVDASGIGSVLHFTGN